MPLHVAISDAILADAKELGAAPICCNSIRTSRRSFVLSVPAA